MARRLLYLVSLDDRLTPVTVPLDPTFGVGGIATVPRPVITPGGEYSYLSVREMVAAPADGIYALATTSAYPLTRTELVRLNAQGQLDPTFDADGRATVAEYTSEQRSFDFVDLVVQTDGKVVVVGTVSDPYLPNGENNNQSDLVVRRFNPDGSLDTSFGAAGTATIGFDARFEYGSFDYATAVAIGTDGRIVLVGRSTERIRSVYFDTYLGHDVVTYYWGNTTHIGVVRLTSNGQLDATFDGDGRALVGLESGFAERFIVDPFAPQPAQRLVTINDVAVAADGGVVLAGSVNEGYPIAYPLPAVSTTDQALTIPPYYSPQETHAFVVRLTAGGSFDAAFDGDGIRYLELEVPPPNRTDRVDYSNTLNQEAKWLSIRPDGDLLVGVLDRTTPVTRFAAIRLNTDATLDTSYGTRGVGTISDGWGYSDMAVADDGRVFVVTGTDVYRGYTGAVSAYSSFISVFTPSGEFDQRYGDDGRQQLPVGTRREPVTPFGLVVSSKGQVTVGAITSGSYAIPAAAPAESATSEPTIYPIPPSVAPEQRAVFVRYAAEPGVAPGVYVSGPSGEVAIYQTGSDGKLYLNTGSYTPFPGYSGTVRMTSADLNGDDILDTIYAMGTGGSRVRVDLGLPADIQPVALVAPIIFDAYEASFTGGIYIAAGDIDGDGTAELVTSPNDGGSARVQAFRLVGNEFVTIDNFFAIEDPAYRGGGRIALGDLNADGKLDLILGAGKGGSTRTAVYDGVGLLRGTLTPPKLLGDFFAIPDTVNLRDGVYVAAGDLNADGRAELIVGSGSGGAPRLLVLDCASLLASRDVSNSVVGTFFVGDIEARAGARVAVRDTNGDGTQDLIATGGTGNRNTVRVYAGPSIWAAHGGEPEAAQVIDWTGDTGPNGVFVG